MAVKKSAKKARPKKKAAKKPAAKRTAPKKKHATKRAKTARKKAPSRSTRTAAAPTRPVRTPPATMKRKEHLKDLLLKKRNEVVKGLEEQLGRKLTVATGQKIDSAMDSADLSLQDMDQGVDYSLLEMKYTQYKDIADAFRKLQNDTYGLCEECGQEIDVKRLEVNPFARYCIECKTRKEAMEKIQKEETRFKE